MYEKIPFKTHKQAYQSNDKHQRWCHKAFKKLEVIGRLFDQLIERKWVADLITSIVLTHFQANELLSNLKNVLFVAS